jgi:integrase
MSGRLRRDLAAFVMAPRKRLAERPPRALPWAYVRRILHSIPQAHVRGKRDFAMFLMMATYGFGAAEVLGLRLDDVDWESKILHARRPKTGALIELPLLPAVAKVLAAYLRHERPGHADSRRIFLDSRMPHYPLFSSTTQVLASAKHWPLSLKLLDGIDQGKSDSTARAAKSVTTRYGQKPPRHYGKFSLPILTMELFSEMPLNGSVSEARQNPSCNNAGLQ